MRRRTKKPGALVGINRTVVRSNGRRRRPHTLPGEKPVESLVVDWNSTCIVSLQSQNGATRNLRLRGALMLCHSKTRLIAGLLMSLALLNFSDMAFARGGGADMEEVAVVAAAAEVDIAVGGGGGGYRGGGGA